MLQDLALSIYGAFVMPGDIVLTMLGVAGDDRTVSMLFIISLTVWFLIAVAGLGVLKLAQNAARFVSAMFRTVMYRMSLAVGNFKTKLILKLRQLFPKRAARNADAIPMVEFDDIDLAVLRTAAARGPGFTTSAPEIAEQLTLRPAQIQRSLEKLSHNKMLEYTIGSTDGFDNYRVSQMGSAFALNWSRQRAGI
jgi:hypothetical protein